MQLSFSLPDHTSLDVDIQAFVIAGWTGRDRAALEKHIKELEELGVARPASTPIFYRNAAARLTQSGFIEATGTASSGEVEFMLVQARGSLWVGVGSDHTDREVETYNVTVSKQMCEKPVAKGLWAFDDVRDHWDQLIIRSSIIENGAQVTYQEGPVAAMLPPLDLIARYTEGGSLAENTAMFCGTLAARGGIRPAATFAFELNDPVRQRTLSHSYDVRTLPVLG